MGVESNSDDSTGEHREEEFIRPAREIASLTDLIPSEFLPEGSEIRRIPRTQPFYERAEMLKSGDILVTFKDGREMRGFRARLVVAMATRVGLSAAVPKEGVFQAVYQEPSERDDSRLDMLIHATNPVIRNYNRKIKSTGLSGKRKRAGERTSYYLDLLRKEPFKPHEIEPSRLQALELLTQESPSIDDIIQALGPSENMGGRFLHWKQAVTSLQRNVNYLYMRVTPSRKRGPANPTESELRTWLNLRNSQEEPDNYLLLHKLLEKINAIETSRKSGTQSDEGGESINPEPLTSYDKAILAVWAHEKRPLLETLGYDLMPEQLVIDLILQDVQADDQQVETNVVTVEEIERDRKMALDRVLKVVRNENFSQFHQAESPTGKDLLQFFWILDESDNGPDSIFGGSNAVS